MAEAVATLADAMRCLQWTYAFAFFFGAPPPEASTHQRNLSFLTSVSMISRKRADPKTNSNVRSGAGSGVARSAPWRILLTVSPAMHALSRGSKSLNTCTSERL